MSFLSSPLRSTSIVFVPAREEHSEFIFGLRHDAVINRFLSAPPKTVDEQRAYISSYRSKESKGSEFYFVIEDHAALRCGTVRVYDIRPHDKPNSFSWGSWILTNDKPRYAAVESALLIYELGFDRMQCTASHFEVMKENVKVVQFHQRFGAEIVGESEESFSMSLTAERFQDVKPQLLKLITRAES